MTTIIQTRKSKVGFAIGSAVSDAFQECFDWLYERGLIAWKDYTSRPSNNDTHCWIDWTFENPDVALLFKLTFGGK